MVTISFFSLDTAGGSGYLGAFLAGLIVGNMEHLGLGEATQPHEQDVRQFAFNLADLVTLIVFMVLGANIPFSELGDNLLPALAVLATLMLVARPITVLVCALPDRGARWTATSWRSCAGRGRRASCRPRWWASSRGSACRTGTCSPAWSPWRSSLTLLLQALPARWLAGRLGCSNPTPARSRSKAKRRNGSAEAQGGERVTSSARSRRATWSPSPASFAGPASRRGGARPRSRSGCATTS